VTSQIAVIPPATQATPPIYGTISVTATSRDSGPSGNIAASDIDQACCGPSILAQNLYGFSGGQDAKNIPVLTNADLATGTQQLMSQADAATSAKAQREMKPGYVLLPLHCSHSLSASHQAGDQAASSTLTLGETCTPLAYFAADIISLAGQHIPIPKAYHLVSFSAFVVESHVTATGGTLTVAAIAYLKRNTLYRFAGSQAA